MVDKSGEFPWTMTRVQFPVRAFFAMTLHTRVHFPVRALQGLGCTFSGQCLLTACCSGAQQSEDKSQLEDISPSFPEHPEKSGVSRNYILYSIYFPPVQDNCYPCMVGSLNFHPVQDFISVRYHRQVGMVRYVNLNPAS